MCELLFIALVFENLSVPDLNRAPVSKVSDLDYSLAWGALRQSTYQLAVANEGPLSIFKIFQSVTKEKQVNLKFGKLFCVNGHHCH